MELQIKLVFSFDSIDGQFGTYSSLRLIPLSSRWIPFQLSSTGTCVGGFQLLKSCFFSLHHTSAPAPSTSLFPISVSHYVVSNSDHDHSLQQYKTMLDYVTREEFVELKDLIMALSGEFTQLSWRVMATGESSHQHERCDNVPIEELESDR